MFRPARPAGGPATLKPEQIESINCGTLAENLAMKLESKWGLCVVRACLFLLKYPY
jgi:hypothetical protein